MLTTLLLGAFLSVLERDFLDVLLVKKIDQSMSSVIPSSLRSPKTISDPTHSSTVRGRIGGANMETLREGSDTVPGRIDGDNGS